MRCSRAAAVLTAASLSMAVAGCATSSSSSTQSASSSTAAAAASSTSSASSAKLQTVFFANPLPTYPDWAIANKCFSAATKRFGLHGVSQGPTGLAVNNEFVLNTMQQAIGQKDSAMLTVPIAPSEYEPIIKRARAQGMLVATLNTGTSTSAQNFEVGTDYTTLGRDLAANIGKRGGQQYLGLVTNGPGGIGATIFKALEAHLPSNVHVVSTAFDKGDPSQTADVVAPMLIAHPNINVIYSWEGTAVAGISAAIKEQHRVGKTVGVVNDLTPQVVSGIHDGTIYGSNWQHFCDMATTAVDNLVAISQGKQVPAQTDSGTTFVTKANLNQILAKAKAGD